VEYGLQLTVTVTLLYTDITNQLDFLGWWQPEHVVCSHADERCPVTAEAQKYSDSSCCPHPSNTESGVKTSDARINGNL